MIGFTKPHFQADLDRGWGPHLPGKAAGSPFELKVQEEQGLGHILEFAGRLCYESWSMPNPATEDTDDYLRHIIQQGHESVLEHASVTFYIEGVSRNLTHELIRHRHLSYSELSQRFVDMSEALVVVPPALREDSRAGVAQLGHDDLENYASDVRLLRGQGKTRKQAREAARYYLPSGMETKIVVTGNLRAWRDVLKKRHSVHADAEIQLLAAEIHKQLSDLYPAVFEDIKKEES